MFEVLHLVVNVCCALLLAATLDARVFLPRTERYPDLGGCEFQRFFEVTPEDLVNDGLYNALAISMWGGIHRDLSVKLACKELGAVRTLQSTLGLTAKKGGQAKQARQMAAARRARRW